MKSAALFLLSAVESEGEHGERRRIAERMGAVFRLYINIFYLVRRAVHRCNAGEVVRRAHAPVQDVGVLVRGAHVPVHHVGEVVRGAHVPVHHVGEVVRHAHVPVHYIGEVVRGVHVPVHHVGEVVR